MSDEATRSPKARRGAPPLFGHDKEWLELRTEEVIEPDLPIIDSHHHLWDRGDGYLLPDLIEDLACGHNVRGTVYVECSHQYHREGDPRFASVGEVAFADGVADEARQIAVVPTEICAGIVGKVDLTLGAFSRDVLEACIAIAPSRFRGIRQMSAWDASSIVHSALIPPPRDLLLDHRFREGFATLAPLGLSFDAWCYHPQLPQLIDLADAFPETVIVVNHMGGPVAVGPYQRNDAFRDWEASIRALATRQNVYVKLGGIGMRWGGFDFIDRPLPPTSEELAVAWKPYIETCIDAFGPRRALFESNFPPDKGGCSARTLWNTFKRLASGFSDDEKSELFAGTAIRVYRLSTQLA